MRYDFERVEQCQPASSKTNEILEKKGNFVLQKFLPMLFKMILWLLGRDFWKILLLFQIGRKSLAPKYFTLILTFLFDFTLK